MGYDNANQWRYHKPRPNQPVRDFHGAAVITEDGTEVPITESMVDGALESLHRAWQRANAARD